MKIQIILITLILLNSQNYTIAQQNTFESINSSTITEQNWLQSYQMLKENRQLNITSIEKIDKLFYGVVKIGSPRIYYLLTQYLSSDFDYSLEGLDNKLLEKLLEFKRNYFYHDLLGLFRSKINQLLIKYYQQKIQSSIIDSPEQINFIKAHDESKLELAEYYIVNNNYDSARNTVFYYKINQDYSKTEDILKKIDADFKMKLKWKTDSLNNIVDSLNKLGEFDQIIKLPISMGQKDYFLKKLNMENSETIKTKYNDSKANMDSIMMLKSVLQLKELFPANFETYLYQIDYANIFDQNDKNELLFQAINDYFNFIKNYGTESFVFPLDIKNSRGSSIEQYLIDIFFKVINFRIINSKYDDAIKLSKNVLILLPNEPNTIKLIEKLSTIKGK